MKEHRKSITDREQYVDGFMAGRNKASSKNCKMNDTDVFPISRNIQ